MGVIDSTQSFFLLARLTHQGFVWGLALATAPNHNAHHSLQLVSVNVHPELQPVCTLQRDFVPKTEILGQRPKISQHRSFTLVSPHCHPLNPSYVPSQLKDLVWSTNHHSSSGKLLQQPAAFPSGPCSSSSMVALLHLASWVVGLLAAAGMGLGLALLLFPELKQWPAGFLQRHLFPDANQISLKKEKAGSNGAASRRSVYRILCFGDSLTEGFTRCVLWCVMVCCVRGSPAAAGGEQG